MDEERRLIERIQAGSQQAFSQLFYKYNNYVYTIAYRLVLDHEDALDITQQVFMRVFQHIGGYVSLGKFRSWLSRITVNEGLRFLARERKELPARLKQDAELKVEKRPVVRKAAEMNAQIEQALKQLPAQQRIVLVLKYYEEMSLKEIAGELGIALGTVKSHLSRGLDKVRGCLEPEISSANEVRK